MKVGHQELILESDEFEILLSFRKLFNIFDKPFNLLQSATDPTSMLVPAILFKIKSE